MSTVTVNGVNASVVYLGPQGSVGGLDQINVQLIRWSAMPGDTYAPILPGKQIRPEQHECLSVDRRTSQFVFKQSHRL